MKQCLAFIFGFGLCLGTGTVSASEGTTPGVSEFARLPAFSRPSLAPDGAHVAVQVPIEGRNRLAIYGWRQDDPGPHVLTALPDRHIERRRWLGPRRLLVEQKFFVKHGGVRYIETRFTAIDRDGGNPVVLNRDRMPLVGPRKPRDSVVDILPDDPRHILFAIHGAAGWAHARLYRIDIETGQRRKVSDGAPRIDQWITDREGSPRLGLREGRKTLTLLWRKAGAGRMHVAGSLAGGRGRVFAPLAFVPGTDRVYALSNHQTGRAAIYEFDLATGAFGRRLFGHDEVDVAGLILSGVDGRPLGVLYIEDDPGIFFLDPGFEAEQRALDQLLPGRLNRFISLSRDGRRAMVLSARDGRPGRYYKWDRKQHRLSLFGARYPGLERAALAPMKAVSYRARDGMALHAYLTLPADRQSGPAPLVVLPHGGPISRNSRGFDYWTQFLVARGYAVLQPNFRGSSGYGRAYEAAGFRQWGLAIQDDITDGVNWMIKEGVADPARVCIVGASFGGYAALMGAVKTPELYRCAVSLAGLSDLPLGMSYGQNYMYSAVYSPDLGRNVIDNGALARASPARHAGDIEAAVLLAHGDADMVVPLAHSTLMARALRRANKNFEMLILPDGNHHLSRERNRQAFFAKLGEFLDRYLGGGNEDGKPRPAK